MFRLYDDLPNKVRVGETDYHLNLAFDAVILAFTALNDKQMTARDRLETFLSVLCIDALPDEDEWASLYAALNEVLRPSQDAGVKRDLNGDPLKTQKSKPDFDFDHDAQAIYAAFWQTYGVDLMRERGRMHWYVFQSLLSGLPDNTAFSRIREIRNTHLGDVKDKNERRQLAKLKREVALPDIDDEEEEGDEYGG
jgi:hypothetical protein